jgi:ribosomal protein S18 acetylase RimI-like enzyme
MIRKAKISDSKQIKKLFEKERGFWDKKWRKNVLELGIKSSNGLSFLFEQEDKIIGFICAHDLGFRGYLSELIVAPDYRKKGVGKKLVKRVERELKRRECKTLISDVWINSKKFYEALGWSRPDVVLIRKKL